MIKRIIQLFKIARKLALSGAIDTIDQIYKLPLIITLFFNFLSRGSKKKIINNAKKPDQLLTVFAGVHTEATNQVRKYCLPYPPSSPSMALFKDGKLVHFIERHHIEGRPAELIAENLTAAFEEFC